MSTEEAADPLAEVRAAITRAREDARSRSDPVDRVAALTVLSGVLAEQGRDVAADRKQSIPDALAEAGSFASLANRTGLTPQRLNTIAGELRREGQLPPPSPGWPKGRPRNDH